MGLHLQILTPNGTAFKGDVSELFVRCKGGPIGIFPGHTTFVGEILERSVLKTRTSEGQIYFALTHGAIEVKPDDEVMIIVGEAKEALSEEEALSIFAPEEVEEEIK
ncbi:MAG: hypothetical protein MJ228_04770 [Bacilli bacterium]|nr:hypothetical protein [Bacilli bacterium]